MPETSQRQTGWTAALALFAIFLSACAGQEAPATRSAGAFLPPTLSASPIPTAHPTPTRTAPTPTPLCVDNLLFLDDLTIPDGSLVPPGTLLDKRWLVQNAGGCNWDDRYRLILIEGRPFGAAEEQALYPARSGTEAEIRIEFVAPQEPGTYRSAWRAVGPQGNPFGDPIFIEFVVESALPTAEGP